MRARILVMTILVGMLAGCTDTADSVAREYRNQVNEALDAMMLVTDESTARVMTARVFKPMADRFKDIDRRLDILAANRSKKEFSLEFIHSDSVHMYISETYLNRKRFKIEQERLKKLAKDVVKLEQERHEKSGSQEPFDPNVACKYLLQVSDNSVLSALDSQLTNTPKMFTQINEMKEWKLDQALLDDMRKRREKFGIPLGELK